MASTLADLKSQLASAAKDVTYVGESPVVYQKNGLRLEGHQLLASYLHQGQRFRKWAVVLPRPSGTVAHVWSYTAPESRFERYRPIAESMLDSWTIQVAGR